MVPAGTRGKKATCQHKEKAEKRQHEKRVTLRGRFQIGVSDDNYKGEHSLRSKWNAGPVPLCGFLPTPCPVLLAGQWDSGPPLSGDRALFRDVSLSGRSCTEPGARRCSPNPPSSSRVSGGRSSRPRERVPGPLPAAGTLARRAISLSVDRPRLQPRELGAAAFGAQRSPGLPAATPRAGTPGREGGRLAPPTHVALQFPLGGRLDEPAGAHSVACAHRGRRRRRRPFLQLGRPPSAGGSRARDSDGAGPAPARPPSAAPCGPATPASGRSPSAPPLPPPGTGATSRGTSQRGKRAAEPRGPLRARAQASGLWPDPQRAHERSPST